MWRKSLLALLLARAHTEQPLPIKRVNGVCLDPLRLWHIHRKRACEFLAGSIPVVLSVLPHSSLIQGAC